MYEELKAKHEKFEENRREVIELSGAIVRLSKKVITAVHNGKDCSLEMSEMDGAVEKLEKFDRHVHVPSFSIAYQEVIEAKLYAEYVTSGKVLGFDELGVDSSDYILGLCDFVGELQRGSVIRISKGDCDFIVRAYDTVTEIYNGLLTISLRGEVRKKFDSVKYVMIRMEEILLQLKLKNA